MTAPDSSPPAAAPRGVAPFLAPLQREFDRNLTDFSGFDLSDMFGPSPRMDLHEADGAIELTAELPGLARDDVHIDLQDDVLTISGEKKSSTESREKGFRMIERRYGSFSRSVRLPAGVQPDKVAATMKDGVLTIKAPIDADAASRRVVIPVKNA